MKEVKKEYILKDIDELIPYINNPRNNDDAVDAVASSIKNFGFNSPIVIDENNEIINGHTRLKASKKLGLEKVPCVQVTGLSKGEKKAYRLADNKTGEIATWDFDLLDIELEQISDMDIDFSMDEFGFDNIDDIGYETTWDKIKNNPLNSSLVDDFLIAPFTIFDTRSGRWQDRKRLWKSLGLKSELGRDDNLLISKSVCNESLTGTSIFDPVLTEILYKWFIPNTGCSIYDPFAGGSVRGVVANKLGYNYTGIELRSEQVEANFENIDEIGKEEDYSCTWICDDSQNVDKYVDDNTMDLVFTCPPYFDLEVYSDNEKDISNMDFEGFSRIYKNILQKACNKLKNDRFFIVIISNVRDKQGFFRDLTGLTKSSLHEKGVYLYNECIISNQVGSKAITARRLMNYRKISRTHQEVLIFYKGNPKNIKDIYTNELQFLELEE